MNGSYESGKILIAYKADIFASNNSKNCVFHAWAMSGKAKMSTLLTTEQIRIGMLMISEIKLTPVHLAIITGAVDILEIFYQNKDILKQITAGGEHNLPPIDLAVLINESSIADALRSALKL